MVIQEWWGLTDHIVADLTERFAAAGFVALAPDLYGGTTTHDAEEAGRLMSELPVGAGLPETWPARSTTSWRATT